MAYYGITCCKNCVPPKRHRACHDTCKEYKEQKEAYQKKIEESKKSKPPVLSEFDFNKINYSNFKRKW